MPQIFSVVQCMVARYRHAVCLSLHWVMHPFTHFIHWTCTLMVHMFTGGVVGRGGGGCCLFLARTVRPLETRNVATQPLPCQGSQGHTVGRGFLFACKQVPRKEKGEGGRVGGHIHILATAKIKWIQSPKDYLPTSSILLLELGSLGCMSFIILVCNILRRAKINIL